MTTSPGCSEWVAAVAIVTVLPFSSAPPRDVALGTALIVDVSGATVFAAEYPGPNVTTWTSSPPPKWRSDTVCTSLIGSWAEAT